MNTLLRTHVGTDIYCKWCFVLGSFYDFFSYVSAVLQKGIPDAVFSSSQKDAVGYSAAKDPQEPQASLSVRDLKFAEVSGGLMVDVLKLASSRWKTDVYF